MGRQDDVVDFRMAEEPEQMCGTGSGCPAGALQATVPTARPSPVAWLQFTEKRPIKQ